MYKGINPPSDRDVGVANRYDTLASWCSRPGDIQGAPWGVTSFIF